MEPCHIEETRSCDMQPQLPPCPGCGADEPENCDCGGYYAGLDQDEPNDYERHDLPVPPPLVGASAPAVLCPYCMGTGESPFCDGEGCPSVSCDRCEGTGKAEAPDAA